MCRADRASCWNRIFLLAFLGGGLALPSLTAAPLPVSPGEVGRTTVAESCGSFSWAAAPAHDLVLEVRRVALEPSGAISSAIWRRIDLPAGSAAWTPSLEECLPPGLYRWRLGERSEEPPVWSDFVAVEIDPPPTPAEVARADAIVRAASRDAESRRLRDGLRDGGRSAGVPGPTVIHEAALSVPDVWGVLADPGPDAGVVWGAHALIESGAAGSAAVVAEATHPSADVFGIFGTTASPDGSGARLQGAGAGDLIRGFSGGVEVFRVAGDGTVFADSFSASGAALTALPDLDCVVECVANSELEQTTIDTADLEDGAVTFDRLKPDAVDSPHLASSGVQTADLADGAVGPADLAPGAVGAAEVASGAIEAHHLAAGSVTTAKIADGAVGERLEIDGDLAVVYRLADGCHDNVAWGPLTFATTCTSLSCGSPPYRSCDGDCNQASPQVCPNTAHNVLLR